MSGENIESNITRLIEQAKNGDGMLADTLASRFDNARANVEQRNRVSEARSGVAAPTGQALIEQVNWEMDQEAARLKLDLVKAAQGESVDLKQFAGMAAAGSAVMSGGILDKIMGFSNLLGFGPAKDFFHGFMSMMQGKSFEEGKRESRLERVANDIAEKLGVDPEELKKELLAGEATETASLASKPLDHSIRARATAVATRGAAGMTGGVEPPSAPDGMIVAAQSGVGGAKHASAGKKSAGGPPPAIAG